MEIIEQLDPLLKTFWYVAIPTSLIFILQTIMTFLGANGADGMHDGSIGGDGLDSPIELFSLRNLINFLLGFSWAGISFYSTISYKPLLISAAFIVGILFVYLFFVIIHQIQKLEEDNSFNILDTINKLGEVYLTVPENKAGKGKILISVNGSMHELEAMTTGIKIESGMKARIIDIEDNVLIIEKI